MEMKKIKDVKEFLMEAITDFAIAEKAGDHFGSEYYMGLVHAYMSVLCEYARMESPWHSLWREAFTAAFI